MATATHAGDGQTLTQEAKGKVGEVASSATADAKSIARDAKGEAQAVAEEAKAKARDLAGDARQQLRTQAEEQASRAAEAMRHLSSQLSSMASAADSGLAPDLAREASTKIDSLARRLDGGGLDELVADVKRFARNKPGTFLLGAVAAGVVAGRLTRATDTTSLVEAAKASGGSSSSAPPQPTPSQGTVDITTGAAAPMLDPIATQPIPADQPRVVERPLRAPGH